MPLEFPVVKTSAAKGDVVLAPARAWIDNAAERGVENQAFIFDPARMMEPGANASVVETRHRQKSLVPNGLIVAIRPAQSADPGDVVLTHWHSRSGLQRAIIVEGGEPAEPLALYLDVAYENPPGWGQKKEKLAPGSFHVLKKVGEVGTTVACTDGQKKRRGVVISRAPERLLVVGYAGLLTSRDPAECQPIPISPKVAEGDQVWVPRLGTFVRAAVTKVDAGSGRVFATAPGEKTPTATGYSNVASKLE